MRISWKPIKVGPFGSAEHPLPFSNLLPDFQCLLYNETFGFSLPQKVFPSGLSLSGLTQRCV